MLAIGSPFLAAVAVNGVIAWLIVLAGGGTPRARVSRARGRQHDLEAAGWNCVPVFRRIPDPASRTGCGVTYRGSASLFLIEGHPERDSCSSRCAPMRGSSWMLIDGIITLLLGLMIYIAMAVECRRGGRPRWWV